MCTGVWDKGVRSTTHAFGRGKGCQGTGEALLIFGGAGVVSRGPLAGILGEWVDGTQRKSLSLKHSSQSKQGEIQILPEPHGKLDRCAAEYEFISEMLEVKKKKKSSRDKSRHKKSPACE